MINNWMTVKVKYTKQLENGTFKRVSEPYLIQAMTHGDAETRIYEELGSIIRGEFNVVGVVPFNVVDIFHFEESYQWWNVQVKTQDPTLESDKIKIITTKYLVTGDTIQDAIKNVTEELEKYISGYTIVGVSMSPIVDIFPYKEELDKELSRTAPVEEEIEEELN